MIKDKTEFREKNKNSQPKQIHFKVSIEQVMKTLTANKALQKAGV